MIEKYIYIFLAFQTIVCQFFFLSKTHTVYLACNENFPTKRRPPKISSMGCVLRVATTRYMLALIYLHRSLKEQYNILKLK